MSMPHECTCRICGAAFSPLEDPLEAMAGRSAAHAAGVRALARAIAKIAPDLAEQLAQRWDKFQVAERAALDDFLLVLRGADLASEVKASPNEEGGGTRD